MASPRIKVLKVVTNFTSGGTEGQIHNLTRALDRRRIDLQFACLKKYGRFLDEVEQWQVPVHEFAIESFFRPATYWQILRLARFMRQQGIQVSHSYNFYSNLIAVPAARLAGVPLVLASVRDRGVYLTRKQTQVQKWTCDLADKILVNADAIRLWLIDQGLPSGKITLIKNGIDMSLYERSESATDIRNELGIPEKCPLVIMLARLNPEKGIEDFLAAAALVKKLQVDVHFLVVGEALGFKQGVIYRNNAYHQHLFEMADQLGISHCTWFTGHRTDVAELLPQCTVSVLPSHSEGLSNSLIESMAAGLPLVATAVGGNPELLQHGINGLLVPVQDVAALASAITVILDDPALAQTFGQASRRLCREQFDMSRMAAATEDIYLTAGNRRTHTGAAGKLE